MAYLGDLHRGDGVHPDCAGGDSVAEDPPRHRPENYQAAAGRSGTSTPPERKRSVRAAEGEGPRDRPPVLPSTAPVVEAMAEALAYPYEEQLVGLGLPPLAKLHGGVVAVQPEPPKPDAVSHRTRRPFRAPPLGRTADHGSGVTGKLTATPAAVMFANGRNHPELGRILDRQHH